MHPYEAIGNSCFNCNGPIWRHQEELPKNDGPIWKHRQHLIENNNGPTHNNRPFLLDGSMWAFTRSLVKLHMGFNGYYGKYLLHGLFKDCWIDGKSSDYPSVNCTELVGSHLSLYFLCISCHHYSPSSHHLIDLLLCHHFVVLCPHLIPCSLPPTLLPWELVPSSLKEPLVGSSYSKSWFMSLTFSLTQYLLCYVLTPCSVSRLPTDYYTATPSHCLSYSSSKALCPRNSVTVLSHSDACPMWSLVCYGLTIE